MGAMVAAAIGLAGSIYSSNKASKQAKDQQKLGQQAIDAADPYKQYRPEAAAQLNALMKDPSSITGTPEYKARLEGAARTLAAQGYTGSGNAILEAANAAGAAYQQAFDNLAILSGANVAPGGGYNSALSANQNANDNTLSSLSGVTNNLANLAMGYGGSSGGFNQPASAGTSGSAGKG